MMTMEGLVNIARMWVANGSFWQSLSFNSQIPSIRNRQIMLFERERNLLRELLILSGSTLGTLKIYVLKPKDFVLPSYLTGLQHKSFQFNTDSSTY